MRAPGFPGLELAPGPAHPASQEGAEEPGGALAQPPGGAFILPPLQPHTRLHPGPLPGVRNRGAGVLTQGRVHGARLRLPGAFPGGVGAGEAETQALGGGQEDGGEA